MDYFMHLCVHIFWLALFFGVMTWAFTPQIRKLQITVRIIVFLSALCLIWLSLTWLSLSFKASLIWAFVEVLTYGVMFSSMYYRARQVRHTITRDKRKEAPASLHWESQWKDPSDCLFFKNRPVFVCFEEDKDFLSHDVRGYVVQLLFCRDGVKRIYEKKFDTLQVETLTPGIQYVDFLVNSRLTVEAVIKTIFNRYEFFPLLEKKFNVKSCEQIAGQIEDALEGIFDCKIDIILHIVRLEWSGEDMEIEASGKNGCSGYEEVNF